MDASQIQRVGRGIERFLAEFSDGLGRCDTERRDQAHPLAMGLVDETGSPKRGTPTAGVQRPGCGRTGKVDNGVVSVHLGYPAGGFHGRLDRDRFLPKHGRTPPHGERRRGFRRTGSTCGRAVYPQRLYRATPPERRPCGKHRRFPRRAGTAANVSAVRDRLRHAPAFRDQPWTPLHLQEGEKGPRVRDGKAIPFGRRRDGWPTRAQGLRAARNPREREAIQFFVSKAPGGTPWEWIPYVGDSRGPIERCFEEDQDERGFDLFEVRGWRAIHRPRYLVESLTVNPIREALAAGFQAVLLPRSARRQVLADAAWRIRYARHHHTKAKVCHRKTMFRKSRKKGLTLGKMRTCIGSNFAL